MDVKNFWGQPQNNVNNYSSIMNHTDIPNNPTYRTILPGRVINQVSDIRPQDILTDGTPVFFPCPSQKVIYVKYLDPTTCDLKTDVYVYDQQAQIIPIPEKQDPMEMLMSKMNEMWKRIDRLENSKDSKSKSNAKYGTEKEE